MGAREQSANSGLLFDSVYLSSLRSKPTQVIHSDPSTSAGAVPDRSTDDSPSNPPQRPPHSEIPFFRFPDDGVAESNESNQQKSSVRNFNNCPSHYSKSELLKLTLKIKHDRTPPRSISLALNLPPKLKMTRSNRRRPRPRKCETRENQYPSLSVRCCHRAVV